MWSDATFCKGWGMSKGIFSMGKEQSNVFDKGRRQSDGALDAGRREIQKTRRGLSTSHRQSIRNLGAGLSSPCKPKVIMSQVEQGMALLINAFHKYSGKEGDKLTLSKAELKDLLTSELRDIFGKTQDKGALDKIFKELDTNADGVVDFQEYVTLVACITMLCNEFFSKK
ncbi:hypothetical protein PGIGA_G00009990 [Pangasianodon gigas]|uniref:Uncharacterized protein n=1 Tax=Pangasianodon gigas TaxID=30993 RepID=A0ACC5W7B8_PANGG|nr:hypothetical protein [Pangasianodon gigas]